MVQRLLSLRTLCWCLALPGAVTSIWAGTAYVDASRPDDSGDGLSWVTAKRTIQAAVDLAQDGDVRRRSLVQEENQ